MFWDIKQTKVSILNSNNHLDVAIIGGGITGLSTAYYLRDSKLNIGIFDYGTIGSGVTSKTTAKITYLQGDIYQRLGTKAKDYYLSQKMATEEIVRIIQSQHINCDLEKISSIIFTVEKQNVSKIKMEKELLESFGAQPFDVYDSTILSGIGVSDSYVFHPLKFLNGLCRVVNKKISFYEKTLVTEIIKNKDGYVLFTSRGKFFAHDVVLACHYPFFLLPNLFPLKTYVQREYVNVTKVKENGHYSAINIDSNLHSVRFYKNYLIYGSNRHRLTSEIDFGKHYEKSQKDFKRIFNQDSIMTWDNQDIVSNDLLPFIGRIDSHLYLGTAYRGWGMTNGVLAGKIISSFLLHYSCPYTALFSPQRFSPLLFGNSFLGTFHYMKVYFETLIKKNNPSYILINGISYAIYEDNEHKIHKIRLVCPHMKCHLVFNSYDKTWDCPCHGSRFSLDGVLLKSPATKSLSKK